MNEFTEPELLTLLQILQQPSLHFSPLDPQYVEKGEAVRAIALKAQAQLRTLKLPEAHDEPS